MVASARLAKACSSIAPAYRQANTPSAIRGPAATRPATSPAARARSAAGTSPAPDAPGSAGPASGSAPAPASRAAPGSSTPAGPRSGPGPGWAAGSSCWRGEPAGPAACAPATGSARRGPRRRPTVVCAMPSRRPISVSDSPCPRQAVALAQSGSPSLEGRPGRAWRISAADPSRSAALCKVAT